MPCSGFDVGMTKLWDYNDRGVSYEELAMRREFLFLTVSHSDNGKTFGGDTWRMKRNKRMERREERH